MITIAGSLCDLLYPLLLLVEPQTCYFSLTTFLLPKRQLVLKQTLKYNTRKHKALMMGHPPFGIIKKLGHYSDKDQKVSA